MNHIRGYQFFPQLFSNPSTPLLFSHLILPAPGAPPLSLVFCLAFAPLSPSLLFLVITHHYQGNLFLAQQTSSWTSNPPFSHPFHSTPHTTTHTPLLRTTWWRAALTGSSITQGGLNTQAAAAGGDFEIQESIFLFFSCVFLASPAASNIHSTSCLLYFLTRPLLSHILTSFLSIKQKSFHKCHITSGSAASVEQTMQKKSETEERGHTKGPLPYPVVSTLPWSKTTSGSRRVRSSSSLASPRFYRLLSDIPVWHWRRFNPYV